MSFSPRTTSPENGNKYYTSTGSGGVNECIVPYNASWRGSCLPNCVGYAWGRWYEILESRPSLSRANAEEWYGHTSDGYRRSPTPAAGAVICWSKGVVGNKNDGAGHVGIVESVDSNGDILVSYSGYGGPRFSTKKYTASSNYSNGSAYRFQGFILLPDSVPIATTLSLATDGTFSSGQVYTGGPIYSSQYTREDGIIREFAYLNDKNEVSLKKSKMKISVINYTSMLQQLSDIFGLASTSYGSTSGGYDTSGLSGNCKIFIDYLIGKGLNRAAACGAAGNIFHESGFDPSAVNPKSGASGIVQWLGSRKTNLISRVPNWKSDLQGQLDFMWDELNSGYTSTLNFLKSAQDTENGAVECARYWCVHYEGIPYPNERGNKALEYYRQIKQSLSVGTSGELKDRFGNSLSLKKTISIPNNVRSYLHGGDDCTCYSYWCHKLGWTQGQVAKVWIQLGQTHDSRNIGTLQGHLTIAMKGTFGDAGDLVRVICEGGLVFTAVLVDIKGSDATSPYGHVKGGDVSPCEWYIWTGNDSVNSVSSFQGIGDWRGKKVTQVENYGSWIHGQGGQTI